MHYVHGTYRTWDISGLDVRSKNYKTTLRHRLNAIMSKDSTEDEPIRLFHSTDNSFREGGTTISFHPNQAEEAKVRIVSLVPYLIYQSLVDFPEVEGTAEKRALLTDTVYKYFGDDALARAEDATWNVEKQRADSQQENKLFDLEAMDQELDMDTLLEKVDTDDNTIIDQHVREANRPYPPGENDSNTNSTMGTAFTNGSMESTKDNNEAGDKVIDHQEFTDQESELLLEELLAQRGKNAVKALLAKLSKKKKPVSGKGSAGNK